jgi:class I lanthipeptide synthase
LLSGEAAAQALAAAKAIAGDLTGDPLAASSLGLAGGLAGLALLFAYLERSLDDPEAGERAERCLDRAITQLAELPSPGASLYHGYTGVAWVVEHLATGELATEDEDPNAEIDAVLLSHLRRSPWQEEFDLLGGLVGWGVYALERLPRPSASDMLGLLVARLGECAEHGEHGVVWRDPRNVARQPDLGMAHGAAGVIALLARIVREGPGNPEAARLLAAAVDGVLSRIALRGATKDDDLAWCAGNAGLSIALLAAGRACGRDDWEGLARRLATAAAERYLDDAGGFDSALCHGTAGLAHLFHRFYQATGDPGLLAAARRWMERTLAQRRPGQGIGGYQSRGRQADGRIGWIPDPGFLGGATGIGLALLAAATPVEPAWDRVLLLSGWQTS